MEGRVKQKVKNIQIMNLQLVQVRFICGLIDLKMVGREADWRIDAFSKC